MQRKAPTPVEWHTVADSLRSGDQTLAASAYRAIVGRIRGRFADHPRVKGAVAADGIESLAQDFCLRLLSNPAKLAASSIKGVGALDTEMRRFLSEPWSTGIESGTYQLKHHFHRKVAEVLRQHPEDFKQEKNWWGLSRPQPAQKLMSHEDPAFLSMLPDLPSILSNPRKDQLPEVARSEDIRGHLIVILQKLGRPLPAKQLAEICWQTLNPKPVQKNVEPLEEETPNKDEGQDAAYYHAEITMALEVEAARIVNAMSPQTRKAVLLRYRSSDEIQPLSFVAEKLGVSKGTAENEVGESNGRFGAAIREAVKRLDLEKQETLRLIRLVLDKLEAGCFLMEEDDHASLG